MMIASYPTAVAEALSPGLAVTLDNDGKVVLLDGPTDQPGTAAVIPHGIAMRTEPITSATSTNATAQILRRGQFTVVAGATDAAATGKFGVAQYNTGRVIPLAEASYVDGSTIYLLGRFLGPAVSGNPVQFEVDITPYTIGTPAGG